MNKYSNYINILIKIFFKLALPAACGSESVNFLKKYNHILSNWYNINYNILQMDTYTLMCTYTLMMIEAGGDNMERPASLLCSHLIR
jgi:hypothetical protein